eukprot:19066-Heterococcus_DN1.PRE.4
MRKVHFVARYTACTTAITAAHMQHFPANDHTVVLKCAGCTCERIAEAIGAIYMCDPAKQSRLLYCNSRVCGQ